MTLFRKLSPAILIFLWKTVLLAEDKDINVNINTGKSGGWPAIYWVIGALVVALLIAITVMATRSSKQA